MRTYITALNLNAPELALAALEAAAEKFNTVTESMTLAMKTAMLLVAGPLLGLAFVIALPIVSVLLTVYYGAKLLAAHATGVAHYVKNIALFFAAPFVGLAYIIAMPFVGLGMVAYYAVKAARK